MDSLICQPTPKRLVVRLLHINFALWGLRLHRKMQILLNCDAYLLFHFNRLQNIFLESCIR
jgi:hypothetical protein